MKKLILGFSLVVLTAFVSGCGVTSTAPAVNQPLGNQPASNQPASGQATPTVNQVTPASGQPVASPSAAPVAPAMPTVTIQNFAFNPADMTIRAGSSVTWLNDDQAAHQVTSAGFTSAVLNTGDSFTQAFPTAGTFDYHCNIHPSMTGRIIVQ